ncbi:hypothetical protein, partial [Fulvivirga lutimaris]|uniref:hypothetical protein n=1 Tax=Fulvivirga lutimaris TaxID=1819566 RepID=UPI0012BCE832
MKFLTDLSILINFSAVVQAIILIAQLKKGKYLNHTSNRLLAFILLAFSIVIINSIRALFDPFFLDSYELFSNAFLLIITPSLYLYISYITRSIEAYSNRQLWHYAPFTVYISLMIVLILFGMGKNDPIVEVVSNIGFLMFILQNGIYITSSFWLLRKHRAYIKKEYSYTTNISLNWVANILLSYSITFILGVSFIIYQIIIAPIPSLINLNIVLILSIHIIVLTYKNLSKPDIL